MVLQATGNPISLSQIQNEFGGVNPISLSEYYRSFSNVPIASGDTIPVSGAITLGNFYNTLRYGFRIIDGSGNSWKYDSNAQCIRLRSGTEMQFTTFSSSTVFNGSVAGIPRFALSNILSQNCVCANTSNRTYTMSNFIPSNSNYAFRFITTDNGLSYRIFNDVNTNVTSLEYGYTADVVSKNQTYYDLYPYTQTWVGYDSTNDVVTPVAWKDTTLPTTWYFDNMRFVAGNTINVASNINTMTLAFPPGRFVALGSGPLSYSSLYSGWLYGNGTYSVNVTRESASRLGYYVYNFRDPTLGNLADGWQCGTIAGDYIETTLPVSIKLQSYILDCGNATLTQRVPTAWTMQAYDANSTLITIDTYTRSGGGIINRVIASPYNQTLYNKFRLTITSVGSTATQIPEMRLFGTMS